MSFPKNRIIMPLFPTKYATESRVTPKIIEFYKSQEQTLPSPSQAPWALTFFFSFFNFRFSFGLS